jgi:peptidoglycan/xylan/chitin deacetylase (PgdA/CDA1 family)
MNFLCASAQVNRILLPVYHTVSDIKLPHIAHLYRVKTVREFEADLDFLLKKYEPIDYFEFRKRIDNKNDKPSFLLSFDDGLSEFYDIIAPVLWRKGVPAINFINSDFVDNKALFFRYKVSVLIDILSEDKALLKADFLQNFNQKYPSFQNDAKAFLLQIKYHNQYILDELAAAIDYDFNTFLKEQKPYLTLSQITDLIKKGFQFGSHSINHPQYQFLDLAEQLRQTKLSTDFVQNTFNLDYRIFAFPFTDFGVSQQFFDILKTENIVDYSFGCAGQKLERFQGHSHRTPFEKGDFSGQMIHDWEMLYFFAKAIIGKNVIQR